jgi:signal transduction histidine kinase/two-component SAPR family response regulator
MQQVIRVLYAEDNALDADLTQSHFAQHAPHFEVAVVNSGQRCLELLTAGTFDLLLLDNHLPDMDGTAILLDVAARGISIPVVMVTGAGDEALVVRLLRLGACDYVPKEGSYLETLPAVLERAVAEHRRAREEGTSGALRPQRILYAECNPADIDLTERHFAEAAPHLSLCVVHSSSEVLAHLQDRTTDLVMTDLRMPDMSALELLRETRHRGISVPFVILTGRGDEAAAIAALRLGACDYIVKRDDYVIQLPYAIDHAIARFQLAQLNRRLRLELEERKRLQQTTDESLALLDTLQVHAPIGIAFMDREFRYRLVNQEMAAINGVPIPAHLGQPVSSVLPKLWSKIEPLCQAVLAGESVRNVELSGETPASPGEERQWVTSCYAVRGQSDTPLGIGVIVKEVTEERRAEAALREHAVQLAEAARQKDEFLAMLAHELRNPLAPMRTALELLQRFSEQRTVVERAHDVIGRQILHMARLLDDLLDVSRITTGRITLNWQELDLQDLVAEAVYSTRALIEARRHSLITALPEQALVIRGDSTRLVQVLVNLLNNAAKYTDEGGVIRIAASSEGADAVLRVQDTGMGISSRLLPRIFDVFTQDDRTLDRAQGGLGLGLTLVRRIVELHGGSVEAHSAGRGLGSEFVVRLPSHVAATDVGTAAPMRSPARSRRTLRCLVVDDNVDAARMLELALSLEGHQVRLAFDGHDAVEAAAEFQPDAVVLDIGLPRMNGYEAARGIRRIPGLGGVLIIAATGYGQDIDREKSRDAGFDLHLVKPIDLDALLHAIDADRTAAPDR